MQAGYTISGGRAEGRLACAPAGSAVTPGGAAGHHRDWALAGLAAVDLEVLPGDPLCAVGSQERDSLGDVAGVAGAP